MGVHPTGEEASRAKRPRSRRSAETTILVAAVLACAPGVVLAAGNGQGRSSGAGPLPPSRPSALERTPERAGTTAYDIPSGELTSALTRWAEVSKKRLLAPSDLVRGLRCEGLSGTYAPEGALSMLLVGTGLGYRDAGTEAVAIVNAQYAQLGSVAPGVTLGELSVTGLAQAGERADGPVIGYRATRSTTATRTDTPLIETPASVSVVPRDLIEDRLSQTAAEALALVPSVAERQSYQGAEAFTIRGFFQDTDNGFKLDSLRTRNVVRFDPQLFERVEVLKGPASLLYGTMEPGGIVNFVTPRPTALPFVSVGGNVGSYGDVRGTFDASYTLGDGVGVRLPFVARRFDSFRDFVDDNRYFGATPSITVPLGDATTARLLVTYIDQDLADDTVLIPLRDNRPLPIPQRRFLGQPGARQKEKLLQTILTVDHRFNENLLWRNAVSFLNTWADRDTVANVFGVNPDGRTIDRARILSDENFDSVQFRSELLAEGRLWGVDHKLLTGVDLNSYTNGLVNNGGFLVPIDAFAPAYDPTVASPNALFDNYRLKGQTQTFGAYIQDQATLLRDLPYLHKLILVSGLRYDAYEQDIRIRGGLFGSPADADGRARESALSPRVGLIYMPMPNLSLYGSYAQSLAPQEINSVVSNPASPQRGELYEAGVKVDLTERFFVTASVFDITKTNVPRTGPIPTITVLTGEERSRGYEVEFAGEILPGWQAFGGYAYIDAIVTKGDEFTTAGNRVFNAPRHRASLWSSYTVQEGPWRGFGGGAGVNFTGDSFGDLANLVLLKGFTTVDAALWYRPDAGTFAFLGAGRPFFQVGVKNLLDERFFLGGNGFNSVTPSVPRTFYVSANVRF